MKVQEFKPSGELTFATVQSDVKRLLQLFLDQETTKIRLDLSEVTHCDSAGLALLIEAKRLCKQHDKPLIIQSMPKMVSALAEFCGVEAMLEQ